jgi:hypothetical protein
MTKKEYLPLLVMLGLTALAVFVVSVLAPDSRESPPRESAPQRVEEVAPAPVEEAPPAPAPAPSGGGGGGAPAPAPEPAPAPPQE